MVPADLAWKIGQGAKRNHQTFSKALVEYARRGVAEEERARERLRGVVEKIQAAKSSEEAEALGAELMEAVFGPQSRAGA
jgi:hypothetical protein